MPIEVGGTVLAVGIWLTQAGTPDVAPGNGKFRADSWTAPMVIAMGLTDDDGHWYDPGNISIGDFLIMLANNDSQNYQSFRVTAIVDNGTWVQLGVELAATGAAFAAPPMGQARTLELIRSTESTGMIARVMLNAATEPVTGQVIDIGMMARNQSIQAFTDPPGISFRARAEASLDGIHWDYLGIFEGADIRSENQHTAQYFRAVLEKVYEAGSVTMLLAWS